MYLFFCIFIFIFLQQFVLTLNPDSVSGSSSIRVRFGFGLGFDSPFYSSMFDSIRFWFNPNSKFPQYIPSPWKTRKLNKKKRINKYFNLCLGALRIFLNYFFVGFKTFKNIYWLVSFKKKVCASIFID